MRKENPHLGGINNVDMAEIQATLTYLNKVEIALD